MEYVYFLLIAVVVALVVYAAHLAAKKRREAMAALALELGAEFSPQSDGDLCERFNQFGTFRTGSDRKAFNTIRGQIAFGGRTFAMTMGDYRYTVGSGKNRHTYTMSYVVLTMPFTEVPSLFVRSENILDKIAGGLGFEDIDFESAEFSGKFHVTSDDKRFAYDIVHPQMMEFLLAVEPPPIQLAGGSLLLARGNSTWDADNFRAHLGWARRFFELWPDHVTTRLRA